MNLTKFYTPKELKELYRKDDLIDVAHEINSDARKGGTNIQLHISQVSYETEKVLTNLGYKLSKNSNQILISWE